MARYRLTARRFEGSLSAPIRNETSSAEGEDLEALQRLAGQLARSGWKVWIMERMPGVGSLHVVEEWSPSSG